MPRDEEESAGAPGPGGHGRGAWATGRRDEGASGQGEPQEGAWAPGQWAGEQLSPLQGQGRRGREGLRQGA